MTATATKVVATPTAKQKSRKRQWWRNAGPGTAVVVAVVVLWEVLARAGVLPEVAFPSASQVGLALISLLGGAAFWSAIGSTLLGAALGLLLVVVVAVPLGAAIGRKRWIDRSTLLTIEFLKPIPPVALLPLALLFWGPSLTMKVFLVFMGALWPLLVQVSYGARGLDGTLLSVGKVYRFGRWKTIRHIIFPTLLPFGLTGLRVSVSIAIIVAVVAELIGGAEGIGQQIAMAQNNADLPKMYAYIVTSGIVGLLANALFSLLDKPLLFWHPSQRSKES